jgi:hypothetical protein
MIESYELGSTFTWANPDQPNQKGWALDEQLRYKLALGTFKTFVIALDNSVVQIDGGLGGIEISFNSPKNGFCMDFKSFPWNWEAKTQTGGYISYQDLLNKGYISIDSGILNISYDLTSHPDYKAFKSEMFSSEWGEISIQYGIGIRILPFVNAYLKG